MSALRDLRYARKARKAGMKNSLRTIREARRYKVKLSLAFALVEQESGNGRNVFGSDPTDSIPVKWRGTRVTRKKYEHYRRNRRAGKGMQGVGPLQITWWELQNYADSLGGCYKPAINLRVGLKTLSELIKERGQKNGIRRYNGSGPAADKYVIEVLAKADRWHRILTK